MNTWDERPEQENLTDIPAQENAEQMQPSDRDDSAPAAEETAEQEFQEISSGAPVSDEPQDSQPSEQGYGAYSSYDAQNPGQQPYGGYGSQNPYTSGNYQSPYGSAYSNNGAQGYQPNMNYGGQPPYGTGYHNAGQQSYQSPYYQYQAGGQPPANGQKPPKKKKTGKIVFASLLSIAIIAAGVGIGFAVRNGVSVEKGNTGVTTTSANASQTNGETKATGGESLTLSPTPAGSNGTSSTDGKLSAEEVYEKLSKSNVGIVIYSADGNSIMGQGSGIIMTQSGYILTCAHVIDEVSNGKIRVVLDDNTEYDATVVGYDARTDIGILKISPTGTLNVAEFGDSNALKVGEQVIAIGNPGGLQFFGSFSDGKVSAIDRPVNSSIGYTMKCIQHTAAISPGNSGGMLVNMYGQVIGINSSKIAQTDYEGIGFAIPISSAKPIIDDLIQHGYVTNRAKLGITYNRINANYQYYMAAYSYGMPTGSLVIESISDDSDIKNYDVQAYDFITAVNGKELQDGTELTEAIENSKPGDEIQLTISRISNGAIKTFNITCKLVEDKGATISSGEETTTQSSGNNPYGSNGNNPFGDSQNPFGFPGF